MPPCNRTKPSIARKCEITHARDAKAGLATASVRSGAKTSSGKKGRMRGNSIKRNADRPRTRAPRRIRPGCSFRIVTLLGQLFDPALTATGLGVTVKGVCGQRKDL